jgi:hypothetical protein
MAKGQRLRQKQVRPEPEFIDIRLPTNNVKRLKYFGNESDSYAEILTKFMDVADHRCRLDAVTREKAWKRESEEYRSLFLRPRSFID